MLLPLLLFWKKQQLLGFHKISIKSKISSSLTGNQSKQIMVIRGGGAQLAVFSATEKKIISLWTILGAILYVFNLLF